MTDLQKKKLLYTLGIGFGIIFLSAFLTSQIFMPLLFGRARSVKVPNLVGSSLSASRRKMKEMGVHVIVRDSVWSETEPIETILEQSPKEGKKVKPEGTIYVVVCMGSKLVTVPTVIGSNYTEAFLLLKNAGLRSTVADSLYSESYRANTVVRSNPTVGTKIEKGNTVKLYLSRGPEPASAEPDTLVEGDLGYLY